MGDSVTALLAVALLAATVAVEEKGEWGEGEGFDGRCARFQDTRRLKGEVWDCNPNRCLQ